MKKLLAVLIILSSCSNQKRPAIDHSHVEEMAKDFMKNNVIPKMKDPKPYEVVSAKLVIKTAADNINDYRFVYDHFSFNHFDSLENKKNLDSIISVSPHPDSVVSVTVNVGYKTKYKRGDIVLDSIKLGYDSRNDKIFLWPF
ncbi:MAG: hypothetical protein M3Z92_16470 [Bacteroidota bacterium]|nr:hypothetical protein [Bacteroidota bacterium]